MGTTLPQMIRPPTGKLQIQRGLKRTAPLFKQNSPQPSAPLAEPPKALMEEPKEVTFIHGTCTGLAVGEIQLQMEPKGARDSISLCSQAHDPQGSELPQPFSKNLG